MSSLMPLRLPPKSSARQRHALPAAAAGSSHRGAFYGGNARECARGKRKTEESLQEKGKRKSGRSFFFPGSSLDHFARRRDEEQKKNHSFISPRLMLPTSSDQQQPRSFVREMARPAATAAILCAGVWLALLLLVFAGSGVSLIDCSCF